MIPQAEFAARRVFQGFQSPAFPALLPFYVTLDCVEPTVLLHNGRRMPMVYQSSSPAEDPWMQELPPSKQAYPVSKRRIQSIEVGLRYVYGGQLVYCEPFRDR